MKHELNISVPWRSNHCLTLINFFREIRQQLLTGNKFIKYLLYAFGKIVLVVIGILIALQITNYNNKATR
jgi:hypothetical protein